MKLFKICYIKRIIENSNKGKIFLKTKILKRGVIFFLHKTNDIHSFKLIEYIYAIQIL